MNMAQRLTCASLVMLLGVATLHEAKGENPTLDMCLVEVQYEARIPAPVAGVLIDMKIKEGTQVKQGDLLAVIDDREAAAQLKIAQYGLKAAQQRAADNIEETYAKKAAEVALADWKKGLQANQDTPGAIADIDIQQKKLVYERSILQIEKAQKDQKLAVLDSNTKAAELEAAQMAIDWRKVLAPVDGEVEKIYLDQDEWVSPGDPILNLVRFDVLDVTGEVDAEEYDRVELLGRPVTVFVSKSRGREVKVQGSIAHVSQIVRSDGSFQVRAEIQNEREGAGWLIQPGLEAKMVIHLE